MEVLQAEFSNLLALAQQGEEIEIMKGGRVVAKLTGVKTVTGEQSHDRTKWLAELAEMRESMVTGKIGLTMDQILEDLRSN